MALGDRVSKALSAAGAVLKRSRKHLVYELPNGNKLTVSSTPSDHRHEDNILRDLRRASGAVSAGPVVGERRRRPHKPGRVEVPSFGPVTALASALRDTGVVERQLRAQIAELEGQVKALQRQNQEFLNLRVVQWMFWWRKARRRWAHRIAR